MHGYLYYLRTGQLVAPRGLCDDQRSFRAEIEGDDIVIWDDMSITIVGLTR